MEIQGTESIFVVRGSLFDTHAAVKEMVAAGFTEKQSETQIRIFSDIIISNLATKKDIADVRRDIEELRSSTKLDIEKLSSETKSDIEKLRSETKSDIENLRLSTKADIEGLRAEIAKWMLGGFMTMIALLVAVLIKLP